MAVYRISTPYLVRQYGATHIKVVPFAGDNRFSLGHVGLVYSLPQTQLSTSSTSLQSFLLEGAEWDSPGNIVFSTPGLRVSLGLNPIHPIGLRIGLDHNDAYRIEYWQQSHLIAQEVIGPNPNVQRGIAVYEKPLPPVVTSLGITHVILYPASGDGFYSLSGLEFMKGGDISH